MDVLGVFLALLSLSTSTSLEQPSSPPLPVIGGSVAASCQWPATVRMPGCSGTLIHPEIVLYAAHCPNASSVGFGVQGNERTVPVSYCASAPEYPQLGYDYAYCRLAQPVLDVPIVPILMGCDVEQLEVGRRVAMVGFGNTSNAGGGFGTKRWIEGAIAGFPSDGRMVGIFYDDPGTGICNGDSGGSAYVQLDDGSWRMFAIASTVPGSCGGSSQHVPAWAAAAFVEAHSGIDVTPCHDADGRWNPSEACDRLPMDPHVDLGKTWANGCGPGDESSRSMTCGPAFGDAPDTTPPALAFVVPSPLEVSIGEPKFRTAVEVEATDDWGIWEVTIQIADEAPIYLSHPPYRIESADFPRGDWPIVARATDWSGNTTEVSVNLAVDAPIVSDPEDTDDGAETVDDDEVPVDDQSATEVDDAMSSGMGLDPDAIGEGGEGCACRAAPGGQGSSSLWGLLLGIVAGRRRWVRARR